jgi:hypothetical protein
MNPNMVAKNRTARLVREARTPVFTSTAQSARERAIARAERDLVTEDYCFICSRCTDHRGEHDDAQIIKAARL